jgi:hypothetical protein
MTVFPYSKAFRLLDASRPTAAFEIARRYRPGASTLAKAAGSVASSTGVSMNAVGLARPALDALVVAEAGGQRVSSDCEPRWRRSETLLYRDRPSQRVIPSKARIQPWGHDPAAT